MKKHIKPPLYSVAATTLVATLLMTLLQPVAIAQSGNIDFGVVEKLSTGSRSMIISGTTLAYDRNTKLLIAPTNGQSKPKITQFKPGMSVQFSYTEAKPLPRLKSLTAIAP